MKNRSIWIDTKYNASKPLKENKTVDVLIIGGGMTGMNVAYNLLNSNLKVCLVEKNKIGEGVTSRSTAKITYLQELIYTKLKKYHSESISKMYLDSQIDAIKTINKIISDNNIECNLEQVKSYVYTNKNSEINNIYEEYKLLKEFNIDIKEGSNINCLKSIYVDDTFVFNPIKYLIGLKNTMKNKIDIYEKTKVSNIKKEKDCYKCVVNGYEVKTKYIVVATHYPYFLKPFFFTLKCYLEKSYICAYKVDKDYKYSSITSNTPTFSNRFYNDKGKIYEIVLSNSHNLCVNNNDYKNFNELCKDKKISFIWSNKDIITNDYLPYIGLIKDNFLIATGYNTWGMTNSTIAGSVISDIITGNNNKYINLFDPKRNINIGKIINVPLILGSNIKSYIGSKINKNKSWYSDKVKFTTINGENVAIYTDESNDTHIVYNKCPHMKCGLTFNEVEKTWDCTCHGSRFDIDGKCIEGPSNYDITYKKI